MNGPINFFMTNQLRNPPMQRVQVQVWPGIHNSFRFITLRITKIGNKTGTNKSRSRFLVSVSCFYPKKFPAHHRRRKVIQPGTFLPTSLRCAPKSRTKTIFRYKRNNHPPHPKYFAFSPPCPRRPLHHKVIIFNKPFITSFIYTDSPLFLV